MTAGLKKTLSSSLRAESAKVKDRFARAKEASASSEPAVTTELSASAPPQTAPPILADSRPKPASASEKTAVGDRSKPAASSAKARSATKIRTSFSILESEYVLLERLQRAGLRRGKPTSKSEIVRAALRALKECPPSDFGRHLDDLP